MLFGETYFFYIQMIKTWTMFVYNLNFVSFTKPFRLLQRFILVIILAYTLMTIKERLIDMD